MEQLIQFTNSEDFINEWAFFITGFNLVPRTDKMIISLEAYYDGFEEERLADERFWKIACNGYFAQRLHAGYLRPFYRLKILQNHPLLWSCSNEIYFSIQGSCDDTASLMGELFLIHNKICGNWVKFHDVFGFLPEILENQSDNQFAAPTPLIEHYLQVLQRHKVKYTINTTQKNREGLSVLLFSSIDFPDDYDYGQPYVVAESFEVLESA